ncbi:unnamed protein product, partial [Mesorhabditis belari]|uniref:Uncharacterized protein n=1 Tax=Mesorhabditis belari TaxID=2138241 RepID=A0AAF3EZD2_9BILA
MTIEKSRFYLSESGGLNDMSLEEEKSPKRHLRRLSEFFHAHTKNDCSTCSKHQEVNDRLEREVQLKRAELRLMEVAMNKVKEAYMDACLEIAQL